MECHILYNQDGDQIVAECNTDVDDDMEEYLIYEEGEIMGCRRLQKTNKNMKREKICQRKL